MACHKDYLTNYTSQVTVGTILGDASLERKSTTSKVRLRLQQTSPKHDSRFLFIWKLYALLCAGPSTFLTKFDKRSNKTHHVNQLSTRSLTLFTEFYDLFYVNGIKTIPSNIGAYITPVTLAF